MNNFSHIYSRYGLAVTLFEIGVNSIENLTSKDFVKILEIGLLHYRVRPKEFQNKDGLVKFEYFRKKEGSPANGIFLCSTVIAKDLKAGQLWDKIEQFQDELSKSETFLTSLRNESASQLYAPIAGEYNNGMKARQTASISFIEAVCCAITTITPLKASFTYKESSGGKLTMANTAVIPDLPLQELRQFIHVFRKVSAFKTENLLEGKYGPDGKIGRPNIEKGNFPFAPKSNSLRALSLLGAIGVWAKEADETNLAGEVLKNLENCPIYLISPEKVQIVRFNHFVVNLARHNRLNSIIDAFFYIYPFSISKNLDFKDKEREYEKVSFFASRFLQLFDPTSFQEFLAVRAEYPNQLEILFKTFFMEKKHIDPQIVSSAKALGAWLNYVAFKVASTEKKEQMREVKAKVLTDLESSAFSAKSGPALISQTIIKAGRFSQTDAPLEAALFMEKTMSGELDLKDAQQMLMAFSRLRSKWEPHVITPDDTSDEAAEEESNDFSDAQE